MIVHSNQTPQNQADDTASLPDSLPRRSAPFTVAPTASLPPGPPSSSSGQSTTDQEAETRTAPFGWVETHRQWLGRRSGAAGVVTPTAPPLPSASISAAAHARQSVSQLVVRRAPPVAGDVLPVLLPSTVGSSELSSATAAAFFAHRAVAPKRPAPTAPRGKKFTSSYHEFVKEQRPLLPRRLSNREREKTLGGMWKGLSETERAKYSASAFLGGNHTLAPAAPKRKPSTARCAAAASLGDYTTGASAAASVAAPSCLAPAAPPATPVCTSAAPPTSTSSPSSQLHLAQSLEQIEMTRDDAVDLLQHIGIGIHNDRLCKHLLGS